MIKKLNNYPKISIVVPAYNKAKYIEQTLQSIIDQDYPNLEVLLFDPGSTDGTLEIIKEQINRHPKIFKLFYKQDKGQLDAINQGFQASSGKIIAYINADDAYLPNAFKKVVTFFTNYPQHKWVVGYCNIIDSHNRTISPFVTQYKNLLLRWNSFLGLLLVNYINQPAVFLSKQTYVDFGPFTGNEKYILEYAMWLKLGQKEMPGILKTNLASFRLIPDSISATQYQELLLHDDYEIIKSYTKNPLLLGIHQLHNYVRIGLLRWI